MGSFINVYPNVEDKMQDLLVVVSLISCGRLHEIYKLLFQVDCRCGWCVRRSKTESSFYSGSLYTSSWSPAGQYLLQFCGIITACILQETENIELENRWFLCLLDFFVKVFQKHQFRRNKFTSLIRNIKL